MRQGLGIYWNIVQDQCQAIVGRLSICLPKSVWGRLEGLSKYSTSQSLWSALNWRDHTPQQVKTHSLLSISLGQNLNFLAKPALLIVYLRETYSRSALCFGIWGTSQVSADFSSPGCQMQVGTKLCLQLVACHSLHQLGNCLQTLLQFSIQNFLTRGNWSLMIPDLLNSVIFTSNWVNLCFSRHSVWKVLQEKVSSWTTGLLLGF